MFTHMPVQVRLTNVDHMKEQIKEELVSVKRDILSLGTASPRELAFLQGRLCTLEWTLKL